MKVGFDKSRSLHHNDLISFTNPNQNQYIFLKYCPDYQENFPAELKEKCVISKDLGTGAFGIVKLGFLKEPESLSPHPSSKAVAIKIINKVRFPYGKSELQKQSNKILNEVTILKSLAHPNIIRLWDVVDLPNTIYIMLEYANGGDLFANVIENTRLSEERAKLYFYQIVTAVYHMHQNHIVHRDLKLENLLLCYRSNEDVPSLVKITDFGLSKMVNNETFLKTICGTKLYIAPEIIRAKLKDDPICDEGNYNSKIDMWSLGVILYIILSGSPPFDKNYPGKTIEMQICDGDFSFPKSSWSDISFEAKDLVKSLLVVQSNKRYNCDETLKHDFLREPEMLEKANLIIENEREHLSKIL